MNLGYTHTKTPQAAARSRASELRNQAANLRAFVMEGKVEFFKEDLITERGKVIRKEGLKVRGMLQEEGRKLIQEAERLELLADLTLEAIGITDNFEYGTTTNTPGSPEPKQPTNDKKGEV